MAPQPTASPLPLQARDNEPQQPSELSRNTPVEQPPILPQSSLSTAEKVRTNAPQMPNESSCAAVQPTLTPHPSSLLPTSTPQFTALQPTIDEVQRSVFEGRQSSPSRATSVPAAEPFTGKHLLI